MSAGLRPSKAGHAFAAIRAPAGSGSSAMRTSVRGASKPNCAGPPGLSGGPVGTGLPPFTWAQSGGRLPESGIRRSVTERPLADRLPQRPSPVASPSAANVAGEK
jgi:hypothetical protein